MSRPFSEDAELDRGSALLRGTLWLPRADPPVPGVLMIAGSGDNDRHNNGLFPPLRDHLVQCGMAVLSYDKRGVARSTGSWRSSRFSHVIEDARFALEWLAGHPSVDASSVGLFGHSEGGWVALRVAATEPRTRYVVTNSGPGISPALQVRYAIPRVMRDARRASVDVQACVLAYDDAVAARRSGASYAQAVDGTSRTTRSDLDEFAGVCESAWPFDGSKADHDPVPDLLRLRCPHLAVFGEADLVVPVVESLRAFRAAATQRPSTAPLEVATFADADHRISVDGVPAEGYLEAVTAFVRGG